MQQQIKLTRSNIKLCEKCKQFEAILLTCKHSLCYDCILSHNYYCPFDLTKQEDLEVKGVPQKYRRKSFKCRFCAWKGLGIDLPNHIQQCLNFKKKCSKPGCKESTLIYRPEVHEKVCEYMEISCPFDSTGSKEKCYQRFLRKDLAEHCKTCKVIDFQKCDKCKSIFRGKHECKVYKCENEGIGCKFDTLNSDQKYEHHQKGCPYDILLCYSCLTSYERKNEQTHKEKVCGKMQKSREFFFNARKLCHDFLEIQPVSSKHFKKFFGLFQQAFYPNGKVVWKDENQFNETESNKIMLKNLKNSFQFESHSYSTSEQVVNLEKRTNINNHTMNDDFYIGDRIDIISGNINSGIDLILKKFNCQYVQKQIFKVGQKCQDLRIEDLFPPDQWSCFFQNYRDYLAFRIYAHLNTALFADCKIITSPYQNLSSDSLFIRIFRNKKEQFSEINTCMNKFLAFLMKSYSSIERFKKLKRGRQQKWKLRQTKNPSRKIRRVKVDNRCVVASFSDPKQLLRLLKDAQAMRSAFSVQILPYMRDALSDYVK